MRPSEISHVTETPAKADEKLPYPRSDAADPAITVEEARAAQTSICRLHNGLIRETGDKDGAVFFCPIGRQYWRYTKQDSGMYAPLPYNAKHIV